MRQNVDDDNHFIINRALCLLAGLESLLSHRLHGHIKQPCKLDYDLGKKNMYCQTASDGTEDNAPKHVVWRLRGTGKVTWHKVIGCLSFNAERH